MSHVDESCHRGVRMEMTLCVVKCIDESCHIRMSHVSEVCATE